MEKLINKKLEEGFFYFQLHNIFIRSKIGKVRGLKSLTKYLTIEFESGHLDIHNKTSVIEIKRPPDIMIEFDWCYEIRNSDGEFIGYIGKPNYQI